MPSITRLVLLNAMTGSKVNLKEVFNGNLNKKQ
jgi:hypothetical protein